MNRLRKSKYHAMLYWILSTEDPEIRAKVSDDRKLWIGDVLAGIDLSTLQKILDLASLIDTNPRVRGSFEKEIQSELSKYRTPKTVQIPEPRRIGVGYRDKGSLRLQHEDHGMSPELEFVYWSEDVLVLMPEDFDPRFITAEEVQSLGTNLEHLRITSVFLEYNRGVSTLTTSQK